MSLPYRLRKARPLVRTGWPFALVAAVATCSHPWDGYEPSPAGGAAGGPGAGGHGGEGGEGVGGGGAAGGGAEGGAGGGVGGAGGAGGGAGGCAPNFAVDCYEGPAGTEGAGICTGGKKVCNEDGMTFGPCLGQTLPSVEVCGGAVDEDCSGAANNRCGAWAKRFGDSNDQETEAVAVDAQNNVIIVGDMEDTADFGGGVLSGGGDRDVFVAKLDTNGNHLWSRVYGDWAGQSGNAVAVDPSGNVIVAGGFGGTLDPGAPLLPLVSAGDSDIFVLKLDPFGNAIWALSFGDAWYQSASGVAAGADGSIVVTGEMDGSVDFGGGPLTSFDAEDGFVLKLTADGTHLWSQRFGESGDDAGQAVALDAAGNVHLTGYFDELMNLGGTGLSDQGDDDGFIAKLTADGAHVWSMSFGPDFAQAGTAIAVDAGGNVVVAGEFNGLVNFGSGDVASAGSTDGFVVKLDAMGTVLWRTTFGGMESDAVRGVAVDAAGNIATIGSFRSIVDFGGGPHTSLGPDDIALLVQSPAGVYQYSRGFGNTSDQDGNAIVFDGQGSLFFVGGMAGTIEFGPGPISAGGSEDAFIVKVLP